MEFAPWQSNLIDNPAGFRHIFEQTHTIAVLGIKPDEYTQTPAYYVPHYLQAAGFEVIPVPVYYQNVTHILGKQVVRNLRDLIGQVDLVNIFRRAEDIPQHLEDLLALSPRAVWIQSGIRNDEVGAALAKADIKVVQDRCIMVEHRRLMGTQP